MRSDVKVAMAIAVVLIGIGVVWVAFFHDGASKDQKDNVDKTTSLKGSDAYTVIESEPITKKDPIPKKTSGGSFVTKYYGDDDKYSTKTATGSEDATAGSSGDGVGKTGAGDWSDIPDKSKRGTPSYLDSWTKVGTKKTTGAKGTTGTTGTWTGLSATARTYVVKHNDSYWSIAKDLWGDGTLYEHIQKANPGVSPNDLRPRMTIKIPPKPVRKGTTSSTVAVAAARHGTTGIDLLTGKRYYIVKEGDRGFWDISKAVYKHGKHYGLIEKANPTLDSRRLRPGQKVWCPDKAVKPVAAVSVRKETVHKSSTEETVPAATSTGEAGAPTKMTLPDGTVFD